MKPEMHSSNVVRPSRAALPLCYLATMACAICLFTLSAHAAEGDSLWSRAFGGPSLDEAYSVIQTFPDGGYLLAGTTYSFGAGEYDMWLVKTNAQGDSLWTRTFGGPDDDYASSVIQTSDGGYLLAGDTWSHGAGQFDMWLVKTNAQGDSLWNRTYGGPSQEWAYSVLQTSDGGYLLAGGTGSFGAGSEDMWLVKTNAQGDSLWSRAFGGPGGDNVRSVIQTSDGGYLLAGRTESFGAGDYDMWLVKTNAQGDSLWSRTYGGNSTDWANSVLQTFPDGGYLLAGGTGSFGAGSEDMWLVKTNAQGDSLWSRAFGGPFNDGASSVIQTSDGGFLLAGGTWSFGAGYYDMWLVKTNAQGDSLWNRTYGGPLVEWAYSVLQTSDGGYLPAGGTGSFGAGYYDMWLVKVEGPGTAVEPTPTAFYPLSFSLYPSFPNPFNPTTVASYELRAASYVTLKVYDTAGKPIATLVDGWRQAGQHEITFDGKNLPSGIYLARLQAGDFTQTQKMLLLK